MNAAYILAPGPADAIRVGELPDPVPAAGEVLVRVAAVAVNSVDTLLRSGRWRSEVTYPLVLGRDLVGTVVATGVGVTDVSPGRSVWTNSAGYGGRPGATSDVVAVDARRLYPLPTGADPVGFVATVHPGATAYGVLVSRARLQPGETLAVIGANGAVGVCLVQLAAARGARVIAVVRDARAAGALRRLGAAKVVVAIADHAAAAAAAAPNGIDVLVDTTGRVDIGTVPESLNVRGRIVLIATRVPIGLDGWSFYTRELELLGFVMSSMTVPELRAAADWIIEHPPLLVGVGRVLPFEACAEAHTLVESGRLPRMPDGTVGRLVLHP